MCELLIRAVDGTNPDPVGNPLRGMPVVVQPDGHTWGNCEVPPEYVIIKLPGVSPDAVIEHTRPWTTRLSFDILDSVPATDTHTIKVSAVDFNPGSGVGKITRAKVESFLTGWGATDISASDNAVTFTVSILDAIRSPRFWAGLDRSGMTLTELDYSPASGTHRVSIDYSGRVFESSKERTAVIKKIRENATIVSHDPDARVVVLDILRSTVRDEFMEEVRRKTERNILRRRRFRISEALVSAAESAGGTFTIDPAEYAGGLIDAVTE